MYFTAEEMSEPGDSREPDLWDQLDGLGRSAVVLLTSEVTDAVHRTACRQFLGADDDPDRPRLLAVTGSGIGDGEQRLPEVRESPDSLRIVVNRISERSTPASTVDASVATRETLTEVPGEDLAAFGSSISDGITALRSNVGGFEAGELRVCVDGFDVLCDLYGAETVVEFALILAQQIRAFGARGQIHLPVPVDDRRVVELATVCDAVVEFRFANGRTEQRWDVHGGGASDWVPLE